MNEYLVSQLKKGRLDKGLKQSDVAKETGIKNTTLSNYENGITEPDMDTFLALCELYELDFVSLMEEAYGIKVPGKNFYIKPSQMEMLKRYDELDAHGKEMVDFTLHKEWERSVSIEKVVTFSPVTQAAHNDHQNEDGEQEKMQEDLSNLKRPE